MTSNRRDVARLAHVSVRTVSNVVNGFSHVAPPTRTRVLAAIAELGYHPSELARNLKRGRSGLVGLVLPELDTPYFAELTRAVVEEGSSRGLTVVIDQTDANLDRELYLIDRTENGSLFDALIISPLAINPQHVRHISSERPLVFLGEMRFDQFDQVRIDNRRAARDAVEHLLGLGRERIAVIGAETVNMAASQFRLQGYRDALSAAGIVADESLVGYVADFRRAQGVAAMNRLLDGPAPPDAVFCFSDPLALGALRACALRGVRVPQEVAVIGFDDVEDGAFATPSLSTISPDKQFIARIAIDRIMAKLDGRHSTPELTIAPHTLIARESSTARETLPPAK